MAKELVDVRTAASLVGVHPSTVVEWIELGYLSWHFVEEGGVTKAFVAKDEVFEAAKKLLGREIKEEGAVEEEGKVPADESAVSAESFTSPSAGQATDWLPEG